MKKTLCKCCLLGTIMFLLQGCNSSKSTNAIAVVENFDVNLYMGKWYEIARLDHKFERDLSHVYAVYSIMENGQIKVENYGIKNGKQKYIQGVARSFGNDNDGNLEVSFFWPFWGDYKIIYLNDDYTLAIVTSSTTNYLWLLARESSVTDKQYKKFLKIVKDYGFNIENIIDGQKGKRWIK